MIKVTDNYIWHESITNQDSYGAMVNMDKHLGVEIIGLTKKKLSLAPFL